MTILIERFLHEPLARETGRPLPWFRVAVFADSSNRACYSKETKKGLFWQGKIENMNYIKNWEQETLYYSSWM